MSDDFFNEPSYPVDKGSRSYAIVWALAAILILIFAGSMFFAKTIETPPNLMVTECKTNIQNLGNALLAYTKDNNGIIPGIDINGKPYWRLIEDTEIGGDSKTPSRSKLKCYSDTSDDPTSYMLDESLSGKSLDSIPLSEYSKTALLYEKPTGKYHRWAFYLDGVVRPYNK